MDAAGAPASDGRTYGVIGASSRHRGTSTAAMRISPVQRVPVIPERDPVRFLRFIPRAIAALQEEDEDSDDDTNKRARVAASSEAIEGLQVVAPGDAKLLQAECAVCLKDFDAGDRLRAMPCAHAFHQQCIFDWLRRNGVCPLCRHPLLGQQPDSDDEEEYQLQQLANIPIE